jgi:hypothetical protein
VNPSKQDRLPTRKVNFASPSHITLSLKQFMGGKRKGAERSNLLDLAPYDTLMFSHLTISKKKTPSKGTTLSHSKTFIK